MILSFLNLHFQNGGLFMSAEDFYQLSYDMLVMISDNLSSIVIFSQSLLIVFLGTILYYLFWRRR